MNGRSSSPLAFIFMLFFLFPIVLAGGGQGPCLIAPRWTRLQIPAKGLSWQSHEEFEGSCDTVPDDKWEISHSPEFDLLVYADGPSGSGRYWIITVAMKSKDQLKPSRGLCLTTSTIGWRTIPQPPSLYLSWIGDRDGDGKPELTIWDSFPLSSDASMAEFGLMGWVYQVDRSGLCTIDINLSRKLAAEIAIAYNTNSEENDKLFRNLQRTAAEALQAVADGRCTW